VYDVVIIGAGVTGGFVARELLRYKVKVALLEKNNDICSEVTKANTAIVHSGYSPKPGSLKAGMTVQANENFDQLCAELQVEFKRPGSLLIAIGDDGLEKIEQKLKRGKKNGVKGMQVLNRAETLDLEPNVNPGVIQSLFVPSTGVVNPWELGIAAIENAVDNGAELYLNTRVAGLEKKGGYYRVKTTNGDFTARYVVNCAGLYSDEISEMVAPPFFKIVPRRGEYFVLDTDAGNHVRRIIFQAREDDTKGCIVCPTVHGNILIGPSAQDLVDKDDTATTREHLDFIKHIIQRSVVNIPFNHVIRSFAGIRPRPNWVARNPATGELECYEDDVKDFILGEPEGCENFFNAAGIKSPGLTCAPEIGRYIAGLVIGKMEQPQVNERFNPCRRKKVRFAELPLEEQRKLIKQDRRYGKIVCRCRKITEAEVVDAIRRNAGARTVDGVKRRAGTGLGRCQGGFCTEEVLKILSRELNKPMEEIEKESRGSYLLCGRTL
jgi:glycerol-3-phosphate dehydrogenase